MPNINYQLINKLIENYDPDSNNSIIIPTFNGKKGNPILIDREFFPDILSIKGDKGAKDIINANKNSIKKIPHKDSSVLNDIDTKKDLSTYLNKP